MKIAEVLLDVRRKNKLSQGDMAERLYVTRQAVSRWETGETTPTIDTLRTISEIFGVDASALLGLDEPPICQSCSMPLADFDSFGTNADDTANAEYCSHCYSKGAFTHERTVDEMVEHNLHFLDEFNAQNGTSYTEMEARDILKLHLMTLKRWQTA